MADFYAKVMGFKVSDWIEDWFVFMRCNADHHTVNFIKGDKIEMHHIAFELKDMSHMQTACEMFAHEEDQDCCGGRCGTGPATTSPPITAIRTSTPSSSTSSSTR